jgi:hypothetical protein
MFAALNIDRGNISNAVSDDMLDDLGLTRVDYVSPLIQTFCLMKTAGVF